MPYGDGQTCNACLHPVLEHANTECLVGCMHPWPPCGCSRTRETATS